MRISDWSSDVCSSDLLEPAAPLRDRASEAAFLMAEQLRFQQVARDRAAVYRNEAVMRPLAFVMEGCRNDFLAAAGRPGDHDRSEEHTSELQSLMRISYAVFCLKKKKKTSKQPVNVHKHLQHIRFGTE